MKSNLIYIVGDKFINFTKHDDVYTYSNFIKLIANKSLMLKRSNLILGQGLSNDEICTLKALAIHGEIGVIHDGLEPLADKELAHKAKIENIMITSPECIIENKIYSAFLNLNDDAADMSDHVTGQHLQGMVFTEAARQMMLAVCEKYILKGLEKNNSYCALLRMESEFLQFGFPIATELTHEFIELKNCKPGRYKAKTITTFSQNDVVIAKVSIDYIFNDKSLLEKKENEMARAALQINKDLYIAKISTTEIMSGIYN